MKEELMKESHESLVNRLLSITERNKQHYDNMKKMGECGVSPQYMMVYQDNVRKIEEYENQFINNKEKNV